MAVDVVVNGIRVGDTVRTSAKARPRKYSNCRWIVKKITPKRAVLSLVICGVELSVEQGYRYPNYWPIDLIEKV